MNWMGKTELQVLWYGSGRVVKPFVSSKHISRSLQVC